MPYEKLDRPESLSWIFKPAATAPTAPPAGAHDLFWPMADGVRLACRIYEAETPAAPMILHFHGRSDSIAACDLIAAGYTGAGLSFAVASYRGYGASDGTPTVSAMFADGERILDHLLAWRREHGHGGPLLVMGRSLGSAAAIDLCLKRQRDFKCLIIISGIGDTLPLMAHTGIAPPKDGMSEADGFGNCEKIAGISLPTLILHGSRDETVPPSLAEKLQAASGARNKRFLLVPGAEHKTVIAQAGPLYFQTIKGFVDDITGASDWRSRRRAQKNRGQGQ
ncbi:MAG: alpha/beta hydrolase [Desulfobulbaceae bacterium]|jgi:alpha-beta hydrolase superfamily lysophospholipase|nr:alpha/beta hydrolase [Desulfobulbaceae bacterium]